MTTWKLAADEHGILSMTDTHDAGLSAKDLETLTRSGELTGLSRGWYAVGRPATPEARHALLTRAMLRAHEGRAVAAHHSALVLLGLPTHRADLATVRLSRRSPGAHRSRQGLKLGRVVPEEALAGNTVVPAMAVAQTGISGGPLSALVAADRALHDHSSPGPSSISRSSGSGTTRATGDWRSSSRSRTDAGSRPARAFSATRSI